MKNSSLSTVLLVGAVISALLSLLLFWFTVGQERQLRDLRAQAMAVNNNRALYNVLAKDSVEYGKKNPAIEPILQASGILPKAGAASAAKTGR